MHESKQHSVFRRTLDLFPKADKRKIGLLLIAQIAVSLLDLLGVILVGLVGAIAVSGVESRQSGGKVSAILKFLHFQNFDFRNQVLALGLIAATFLVFRSITSAYLMRRIILFLALRGSILSTRLIGKLFSSNLLFIRRRTEKETIFALTSGIEEISIKILGTFAAGISDISLLLFLVSGLLVVQPLVAVSSFLFFAFLAWILHRVVTSRMRMLGQLNTQLTIASSEGISQTIEGYRELAVRNQLPYAISKISTIRTELAKTQGDLAFMPNIGKYVIETGVVLGALSLSGAQFLLSDAVHAVSTLAIFLTAGARVAPALLRLQQGFGIYRTSIAAASTTLELAESLEAQNFPEISDISTYKCDHKGFLGKVELSDVTLLYPNASVPALSEISLDVLPGEFVAVVGPSGAGKTSLVDVLLGLINPTEGKARISGESPLFARSTWPGAVAYVPQDATVINGTLRQNLTLGFPDDDVDEKIIWKVLEQSALSDFAKSLPSGVNETVGEKGLKLSGGQKQRMAIARALITSPQILVLDEATSSLDADTEKTVSEAVEKLHGKVTLVVIAHRLSSIRNADKVIYLEKGRIKAQGNFEELRSQVPDFDRQAKLMGL